MLGVEQVKRRLRRGAHRALQRVSGGATDRMDEAFTAALTLP